MKTVFALLINQPAVQSGGVICHEYLYFVYQALHMTNICSLRARAHSGVYLVTAFV